MKRTRGGHTFKAPSFQCSSASMRAVSWSPCQCKNSCITFSNTYGVSVHFRNSQRCSTIYFNATLRNFQIFGGKWITAAIRRSRVTFSRAWKSSFPVSSLARAGTSTATSNSLNYITSNEFCIEMRSAKLYNSWLQWTLVDIFTIVGHSISELQKLKYRDISSPRTRHTIEL